MLKSKTSVSMFKILLDGMRAYFNQQNQLIVNNYETRYKDLIHRQNTIG